MTLTIEVRAKPGKAGELYQTLQALLPTMRKEGCLNCLVIQNAEEGETFIFSGDWGVPGDLETYIRSTSGSALLGAIDLLGTSSRVRLGSDAKWKGIEVLKRMRKET